MRREISPGTGERFLATLEMTDKLHIALEVSLMAVCSMTNESIATILASQQMQRALHEAAWAAHVLLRADATIIFAFTDEQQFRAAVWHGVEAADAALDARGAYVQSLRAGRRAIAWSQSDQCADADVRGLIERLAPGGGLMVPLFVNADLVGVWLVAATPARTFGEHDELMLRTLAENISLTTESVLLSAENLRYRRETDALYEIGKEISQLLDLDRALEVIAEKTCALLNAEISYIALADDAAQVIRVRVTQGTHHDALRHMVIRYGEGVGGYVATTRTPLLLDNYPRDARPKPAGIADIVASEEIISVICVPMFTRQKLVGVLYAASRREAAFKPAQLDLLYALGTQAAIAIENARLYQEAKVTSERLRADRNTHTQLLNLVLNNQGLLAIADTLSDLVHLPIVVENSRLHLVCASSRGCVAIDDRQIANLHSSSVELWHNPVFSDQLTILRDERRLVRVPPQPDRRIYHPRVIAPIVAGANLLGYVSAWEVGQNLTEQQCAAIEQASIVFALEFLKQDAAEAVEQRLAGDFLDDLISGRGTSDPAIQQRARRYRFDWTRAHRVVVLDIDGFAEAIKEHRWTETDALTIKRRFVGTARDVITADAPGALIGTRGDSLIAIVPARDLSALAQAMQHALRAALAEVTVSVGIGRAADTVAGLPGSYDDARAVIRAANRAGARGSVATFESLGVLPLLLQTQDQQGLMDFQERHLRALLDYDARHQTQLVSTLTAYLAHSGSLQKTATACHVHLNSLKYRMRRIREITGLDLDDGEVRFNLQLALSIHSALTMLRDA
ncbi:MAG: GAF domain-containing protein [Chloroflexi bacterium]|nr:GAF domain-containing protein [Chloroflexota bacterium]